MSKEQPKLINYAEKAREAFWAGDDSDQIKTFEDGQKPRPIEPSQFSFRIDRPADSNRAAAVLEAIGFDRNSFSVTPEFTPSPEQKISHAINRVGRRHQLTNRELEVLALMIDGLSNQEIGRKLDISRATVKWHSHNLYAKTNVGTLADLTRLVFMNALANV